MTLPPLELVENIGGDSKNYVDTLYAIYLDDFVNNNPFFQGAKVVVKKHPARTIQGGFYHATFYHIITDDKGAGEDYRVFSPERAKRIKYPKYYIENCVYLSGFHVWKNTRNGESRICIVDSQWEYLVVLAERKGYLLFYTAYTIDYQSKRAKLQREYAKNKII